MKHPVEVKHEHYRQLFLDARADRSRVRGSLAIPVAATAFTVFNLGTLAQSFDAARATAPLGLAIGALATASVIALLAAVYYAIRSEWHFVHSDPPDLPEIKRLEEQIRELHQETDQAALDGEVSREIQNILTGSYYVGYGAYIVGNATTSRYRTMALRLILIALACMAVAFLLLPFQLGGGSSS